MRVLIAPDSFGGTLTAVQAADAIAAGWRRTDPGAVLSTRPLSDGGPGFLDVLAQGEPLAGARRLPVPTRDPLGRPRAGSVLLSGEVAYVESAQAVGLHLLAPAERDPIRTTSFGVGTLIAAAVDAGARRVVVGLGGSATNDGGAGLLAGLGVVVRDEYGAPLPYGGGALITAAAVTGTPLLRGAELVAASDVDNPLLGPNGASAIFGPQKGAGPDEVQRLDAALTRWAEVLRAGLPTAPADLAERPGAGAAGGLGAALFALGGQRESGIELVRSAVGLSAAVAAADLVISGEGSFDYQSLRGKVAVGVAAAAAEHGVPCLVLAGQVAVGRREMAAAGVEAAYSVAEQAGSVVAAMQHPVDRLADLAARVARTWRGPASSPTDH